jgi:hypothetical protein
MLTHVRAGWKFFHLGRRYADLNSPVYSADDVMCMLSLTAMSVPALRVL